MSFLTVVLALAASAATPAPAPKAKPKPKAPECRAQTLAKTAALAFPDGRVITVEVADAPDTREIGLMCRTKLPRDRGMLFVFPSEMGLGFWMKKTLIPLDILWIGADRRITVIHERLKASKVDTADGDVARAGGRGQFVLELASGEASRRGLKAGDLLKFEAAIPSR